MKVAVDKYIDKNGVEKDKEVELRFIDSFKFMSSSLDSLTTNVVGGGQKLFGFEEYTQSQYELLIKRESIVVGVFDLHVPDAFECQKSLSEK